MKLLFILFIIKMFAPINIFIIKMFAPINIFKLIVYIFQASFFFDMAFILFFIKS